MLGGEHDIFRAGVAEYLGPGLRLPFLNFLIEGGSKVVVVVVSPIVFAMICLGGGPFDPHYVQVPFGVRVVLDVVRGGEVVLGMNERSPARNRIETPVN